MRAVLICSRWYGPGPCRSVRKGHTNGSRCRIRSMRWRHWQRSSGAQLASSPTCGSSAPAWRTCTSISWRTKWPATPTRSRKPMLKVRATSGLAWAYLLETWRARPALFWNIAFPLLFVVGLSYIFGGGESPRVQQILPGIMTINLIAAVFFGITLHIVSLRDSGLYRRYRATPINELTVVIAHAVTAAVNILVSLFLQLAVAILLFRVQVAGSIIQLLVAFVVCAFAFIPLGLLVGSTARD